uniref:Protein quiver n=1 Tax=Anopheles christyi TaxID=43041 RepID=A0A182K022_9DIPT
MPNPSEANKVVVLIPFVLMLVQFNTPTVEALRCYACGLTQTSGDVRCVTEPQSVEGQSVVTCSRKYCTITRQELVDPPGKLVTFLRGCEENPLYLDEVIEDPTFITYYRSCTTDLCNDGDALGSSGSALTGLNEGASDNLLVPGLANSGMSPTSTTSPLLLIIKITSLSLSVARIIT